MKFLNFTIAETTGRTFEIPYDKALEIIERIKKSDKYLAEESTEDEYEMARFFEEAGLDEIAKYELDNDYFQSEIASADIYETSEG